MLCSPFKVSALHDKQVYSRQDVVAQLIRLDDELEKRESYISVRQGRIDSLKRVLAHHPSPNIYLKLGEQYISFRNDSAIAYFTRGLEMARNLPDSTIYRIFLLRRAAILPLGGFISEAQVDYASVSPQELPDSLQAMYYDIGRQMYSYISSFYPTFPRVRNNYLSKSKMAQIDFLNYADVATPQYQLNWGESLYHQGQYFHAWEILEQLQQSLPETDSKYAIVTHILADISRILGHEYDYLYYLTLSAIADIKCSTLEVTSLQELAQKMFSYGDVDRAHTYLSTALRNAVECHAETRMLQTSEALPLIESVHQAELKSYTSMLVIGIVVLAVLFLVMLAMLFVLRRHIVIQRRLQLHLEESNKIKETYISQFVNLCSVYMDKLNKFCSLVNRKISSGQVDDLARLARSGKLVESEQKEFYNTFDDAFLHLYPGFVDEVNNLLRPEERIVLSEGEKLNTDLRILAFMRLGIEESTRIAQILSYSVNTIYTYRNKLRNKAIDRDTFEDSVRNIS